MYISNNSKNFIEWITKLKELDSFVSRLEKDLTEVINAINVKYRNRLA